jgi:hypothetical protein
MGTYNIGCYWKNREEGVDACAKRAAEYLKKLAACDSVFAKAFIASRKHNSPSPVSANSDMLKPLLEDKTADKWGCRIAFVSDHKDRDEQWAIHIRCGAAPKKPGKGWPNFCMPLLPRKGSSLESLLQPSTLSCLIHAMVEVWDPDWAVVYDEDTLDDFYQRAGLRGHAHKEIFLGWMTYFAKRIGKVPDNLPAYSRLDLERGTLLTLAQEPIDVDRPDHVNAVQTVWLGLRNAGLIPAQP